MTKQRRGGVGTGWQRPGLSYIPPGCDKQATGPTDHRTYPEIQTKYLKFNVNMQNFNGLMRPPGTHQPLLNAP